MKLESEVNDAIAHMGSVLGNKFGSNSTPLLVSVRSGSRFSMPGMMDTVLNLGLNNENVVALADSAGNPRFAYDVTGDLFKCMVTWYWGLIAICLKRFLMI